MRAFLLGLAAWAIAAAAAASAVGITADAGGWEPFRLALGPFTLLVFEREGASAAFELGPGLLALALAGALLNLLGAVLLRRNRPASGGAAGVHRTG